MSQIDIKGGASGPISHNDLTDVTANQHHAQVHNNNDHTTTGTPGNSTLADVAAQGSSASIARLDHKHGRESYDTPYTFPFETLYEWAEDLYFPISAITTHGLGSSLSGTGALTVASFSNTESVFDLSSGGTSGGYATLWLSTNAAANRIVALSAIPTRMKWRASTGFGASTLVQRMELMGLGSSVVNGTAYAAAGANSFVGFRIDVTSANTALIAVTKTGASETTTTTSVTEVINTRHTFEIIATSTQILYYIDGVLEATHTTNIPTAAIGPIISIRNKENAVKAVSVDWMKFSGPRA